MDYLGKGELFTNTDLDRFVKNFERNRPFVYIEKSDIWVQLMKNGGKNKSVAFIILFSIYIYIYIYIINIHSAHTYIMWTKTFISDAINHD